jgi:hypothetical protein
MLLRGVLVFACHACRLKVWVPATTTMRLQAVVEGWFVLDAPTAARVRCVLTTEGVPRKALPQEGGGWDPGVQIMVC